MGRHTKITYCNLAGVIRYLNRDVVLIRLAWLNRQNRNSRCPKSPVGVAPVGYPYYQRNNQGKQRNPIVCRQGIQKIHEREVSVTTVLIDNDIYVW